MKTKLNIEKSDLLKQHLHLFLLALSVFALLACNPQPGSKSDNPKPKVVVSIAPQKFIVEKIAGDLVDVMVMIPPGTSPHVYDPTPRQMMDVGKSDVYFFIGNLGFEAAWYFSIKDAYPQLTLVNLNDDLELIAGEDVEHGDHSHVGFNPHTWMSPRNLLLMGKKIERVLSEKYPQMQPKFSQNLSSFEDEMNQTDKMITGLLSDLPHRTFMIFHPSLTYFARDYGLNELAIEFEGKEPAPSQLRQSIDKARSAGVKVIFVQKEFDTENAKIIAKEIGARIVGIDPLSVNWKESIMQLANELKNSYNADNEAATR